MINEISAALVILVYLPILRLKEVGFMLFALLKKQFSMIYSHMTQGRSGKKGGRAIGVVMVLMFVFLVAYTAVMSGIAAAFLLDSWTDSGYSWLCFTLLCSLSVLVSVIFSLLTSPSQLYGAKDNDLLLSMPIPAGYILLCRTIPLYTEGFIINAVIMFPAFVVFGCRFNIILPATVSFGLILLLLPLFSLGISLLFALVFAKISRYIKHKEPLALLGAVVFIDGYFFLYVKLMSGFDSIISEQEKIGMFFEKYLKVLAGAGKSAVGQSSSTPVFLVMIAFFALVYALLSATYIKTVTSRKIEVSRTFVKSEIKKGSRFGALLSKEFLRFTGCTVYFTNCGLGSVILLMGAVFMVLRGRWLYIIMEENFTDYVSFVPPLAVLAASFVSSMNAVSASSVSLEGRSLWIIESLPISRREIISSKLTLHFLVTAPASAVFALCTAAAMKFSIISGVLSVIIPPVVVFLLGEIGLMLNLRFPVFDWDNETYPVKQSMSVGAAIFSGFGLILVLCGGMLGLIQLGFSEEAALACGLAVTAVTSSVMYRILLTYQ